jgi:hypothetical protein
MKSPFCLCMSHKTSDEWTNFHKTWYKHYTAGGHSNSTILYFLWPLINYGGHMNWWGRRDGARDCYWILEHTDVFTGLIKLCYICSFVCLIVCAYTESGPLGESCSNIVCMHKPKRTTNFCGSVHQLKLLKHISDTASSSYSVMPLRNS